PTARGGLSLLRSPGAVAVRAGRAVDQRGRDLAGGAAGVRVSVHGGRPGRAIVKQGELPGEVVGVDRSRLVCQVAEQRADRLAVGVRRLSGRAGGTVLGAGVHECTAAERRVGEGLSEPVKDPEQTITGRLVAGELLVDTLVPVLVTAV